MVDPGTRLDRDIGERRLQSTVLTLGEDTSCDAATSYSCDTCNDTLAIHVT